ncbi:MAG: TIGR03758 family integrating conjugative element protein [Gammaproteobacteria bacterium]|nr:TIGR03758 family integrating conjugative element protein [Gammaproteobacteria bacterium]
MIRPFLWLAEDTLNCAAAGLADDARRICLAKAFQAGAGVLPKDLSVAISTIILTAVFLWVAWLSFSQYQSFANGEISFYDLMWRVIRGIVVLSLFTIVVGNWSG